MHVPTRTARRWREDTAQSLLIVVIFGTLLLAGAGYLAFRYRKAAGIDQQLYWPLVALVLLGIVFGIVARDLVSLIWRLADRMVLAAHAHSKRGVTSVVEWVVSWWPLSRSRGKIPRDLPPDPLAALLSEPAPTTEPEFPQYGFPGRFQQNQDLSEAPTWRP